MSHCKPKQKLAKTLQHLNHKKGEIKMEIKLLGSGCPNCRRLEKNLLVALEQLNIEKKIIKVTEYTEIVSFGVMSTPALVLDGKVLFAGKVPSVEKLKKYFV